MRRFTATIGITLAGLWFYTSAGAEAQQPQPSDHAMPQSAVCFPSCRTGYMCHNGVCISRCNPPCGPAEACTAAGECVVLAAPPPSKAAPPLPENNDGSLHRFRWGYGQIGGIVSPYGWGGTHIESTHANYNLTSKVAGGIHLSGYLVASKKCHFGGYLNYFTNTIKFDNYEDDFEHLGVGISIKAGRQVGDRVWLGFVGDFGYYSLLLKNSDKKYRGIEISPRFHIDVLTQSINTFKMGFFASIGPSIVPFVKYKHEGYYEHITFFTIQLHLGLTFGA
jgi:hypothetical protein